MLFVMGATGRMGGAVLRHAGVAMRAASRSGKPPSGGAGMGNTEWTRFDLDDSSTFAPALNGCDRLFVMRPPATTRRAPFDALMDAALEAGIGHIICASVYGAGASRVLPHRHMEAAVEDSGLPHTLLRPADFMQNLADVHGADIRRLGRIAVPAGDGRSAFLDVEDVGRACAAILADPMRHDGQAYDLTGPEALRFGDVARIMTEVLGREVRYDAVSAPRFVLRQRRQGRPWIMALVMAALYTMQRRGYAAPVSTDFERLTGESQGDLEGYVQREKVQFLA